MATMGTRSRITKPAPSPSPIPTAKGSRSASNEILTQFLDKSVHIPDLTLPASHFPKTASRRQTPAAVDIRSIASGATVSIDRLLGSAKEFGAFVITGHDISIDELRSLVEEAELARSEMVWVGGGNKRTECLQRVIGVDSYGDFSGNMEKVAHKLDAIVEILSRVFFENAEKTTTLSLYRYNHQNVMEPYTHLQINETKVKVFDHALSLHLPFECCEIRIRSERGLNLCFDATPETMVVTVGKQLEEWSKQEFKCVSGEIIFEPPHIHGSSQPSFSIELKLLTSKFNNVLDINCSKTISIIDQIVVALTFGLVYKFFVFISSQITGT